MTPEGEFTYFMLTAFETRWIFRNGNGSSVNLQCIRGMGRRRFDWSGKSRILLSHSPFLLRNRWKGQDPLGQFERPGKGDCSRVFHFLCLRLGTFNRGTLLWSIQCIGFTILRLEIFPQIMETVDLEDYIKRAIMMKQSMVEHSFMHRMHGEESCPNDGTCCDSSNPVLIEHYSVQSQYHLTDWTQLLHLIIYLIISFMW